MNLRHSIVTRFALFFTGLIVFSILLSGYLVFRKASQVITAHSKERIMHATELAEQSFYALLNEVTNDIAVIALSPTLQQHILQPSEKTTNDIDQLFRIILENKETYFQIRLLEADENGKEIIRFDKLEDRVLKLTDLQQKGDREYFKEALQINKGEHYFSNINLNEEYGVISTPFTPTLRVASPIFDNENKKVGILIININLSPLYLSLDQIAGNDSQFYLIDAQGQYLYSHDRSRQFGQQTRKFQNFYSDFNVSYSSQSLPKDGFHQLTGQNNSSYLSYFKELPYFDGKRKIFLISNMDQNILLKNALNVRSDSIQTLLWVCLFSILLSWFFTNLFSKKITKITKAISNYDQGIPDDHALPTNRKDEIGILANTFAKMKVKIDQNVLELNTALEKEQLARKQRDEFLQNMSHEMRTPLNAILGLTKLLYKNALEPQLPIINALERSSNSLAGLVYDVLDHQKLVEGKLHIQLESTNIAELLRNIHSTYLYEAVQKGLTFNLSIDKKLETTLFQTDALRLTQIVTNLVVNAIKYTKKGIISLSASINGTENQTLNIKVNDTGVGVLPKNLNRINDRFFMEKNDLSGRYGSYGLGLSIVKQLTSLFGGTLMASSEKGKGSEFLISIPTISSSTPKLAKPIPSSVLPLPKLSGNYNILHIEDDASTLELIKHILNFDNISLQQTKSLDEALKSINSDTLHLIISDLMLENEKINSRLEHWIEAKKINCPLIIISALDANEANTPYSEYFQKPFQIDQLKDTVHKILGSNEFKAPDFSNIYSNYDHDIPKINKVLKLLEKEFENYLKGINKIGGSKDQVKWEAMIHKLIAHINNLKLTDLKEVLPDKISAINIDVLNKINNVFAYYLCCIRAERHLNLKVGSS
ncbi:ATP-binding protein [Arenibacter echinorum]|uniref:histidine kinase n=1 Tax=Arenibacter echinorum TaxID=440515 RepID=A0A327QWW0_9FLAO|nr:ATP-binding protein [Arenibacter echinorum]RAJ06157.1 signal transduction histidine kinase [Arenibacter echinorum]